MRVFFRNNLFKGLCIVLVLMGFNSLNAISFDMDIGVTQGKTSILGKENNLIIPSIDFYVPLGSNLDLGMGVSYMLLLLDKSQLSNNTIPTENSSFGFIPTYVTLKYTYNFNKDIVIFSNVRAGVSYLDNNYYRSEDSACVGDLAQANCFSYNINKLSGGSLLGIGVGLGYKSFMFSLNYDTLKMKNTDTNISYIRVYENADGTGDIIARPIEDSSSSFMNHSFNIVSFKVAYLISYDSGK